MQPVRVAAGERIFSIGDPSDFVYIIEDGSVTISVGEADALFDVAHLGPGELFGESGVLENRVRAAHATAAQPTRLIVTEGAAFLDAFNLRNDKSLALLKLLCRRLRQTNDLAAHPLEHIEQAEDGPGAARARLRLLPMLGGLCPEYDNVPVMIEHLPYQVGNRFGGETMAIGNHNALSIPLHGEAAFATPHFEILKRDGRIGVRDLGSRTGTIVNGHTLTRESLEAFIALRPGVNEVVAGKAGSSLRFRIDLPR